MFETGFILLCDVFSSRHDELCKVVLNTLLSHSQAFNKNNLILEERNKYFNPQLAGKTYTNAYFTDVNTYDDY